MVLVLILNIILFFVLLREKLIFKPAIVLAYSIPIFLLALWGLEYGTGRIQFFISDESEYVRDALFFGFPNMNDRFLWQLVNYWVVHNDIYMSGLPLKLINIPLYVGFIYLLRKIFPYEGIGLLPVLLLYLPFSAVFNLRDVAIWFFSTLSIYLSSKSSWKSGLSVFPLILLYMLRPFAAILIFSLILIMRLPELLSHMKKDRDPSLAMLRIVFSVMLIALLLVIVYPILHQRIEAYSAWVEYTTHEGKMKYEEGLPSPILTGNRAVDFTIASVRYFTTPMPQSLLMRIASGGSEQWGLVDDLVRIINQIGYYGVLLYLLLNYRLIYAAVSSLSRIQGIVIINLAMYWPIYSYYLYGVTHQRLKLPLQISLFLIALAVHNKKREMNEEVCIS